MRDMRFIHFHLAFMVFAEFHQHVTAKSFTVLFSAQALLPAFFGFLKPSKAWCIAKTG